MIIRIVMVCYFRIGNKRYQELYGSFGAMNIQKRHVKFSNRGGKEIMHIEFKGKKGVLNSCDVMDRQLIKEMKNIMSTIEDDDMVFRWLDGGVKIPVRAIDINYWLKTFNAAITSKDFRTYDSNIFLIIFLKSQRAPEKMTKVARKKILVKAMKEISEKIHNTPAILKKNYTQGGIVKMYMDEPHRWTRYFAKGTPRQSFMNYLRDYCKDYLKGVSKKNTH